MSSNSHFTKIDGPSDLLDKYLLQGIPRAAYRTSCGVLVAPAAELLCDLANVDIAFRAHADTTFVALELLEENGGFDLLHRKRQVDQAFCVLVCAASHTGHL